MLETKPHVAGNPIVFTHIPKTAGTSLVAALVASLDAHPTHVYDRSPFGTFADWASVDISRRSMVVGLEGRVPPQPPGTLVNSHAAFSTTRSAYPGAEHIIVFREGRSRLLSVWLYHRSMVDTELDMWGGLGSIWRSARGSLRDYLGVDALAPALDNATVRQLLWPHPAIPADRAIDPGDDEELLELAREQLRRFSFRAVVEDPGWVRSLGKWLGAVTVMPRLNVTPVTEANLGDRSAHLRAAADMRLEMFSRLDNVLWMEAATAALGREGAAAAFHVTRQRSLRRYAAVLAAER